MQSYNLQRWQGALLAGGRGSRGTVCRVGPPFWRVFFFLTSTRVSSSGVIIIVICAYCKYKSRAALEKGYRGYSKTSRQAKSSRLMNRSAILGQSSHIVCRGLWFNSRNEIGCGVPLRLVLHRAVLVASAC